MTTATAPAVSSDAYAAAFARRAESGAGEPLPLTELRRRAMDRFQSLGFPASRLEEWRSFNVAPIAKSEFDLEPSGDGVGDADLEPYRYRDTHELVFVDGRFSAELSKLAELPDGVFAGTLATALAERPDAVMKHLGRHAKFDDHAFVALNTALFTDGVYVHVPRGVVLERAIHIIHAGTVGGVGSVGTAGSPAPASFPRFLFVAEESAQFTVVEQHVTVGDGNHFTCPVSEFVVGDNAVVDHYKIERESTEAFHLATLQLYQTRDANFSSHSLSWGGALVRNDVNAILDGEGGEATLNGLYMVEGTQVVDNHMRVEHAKAHCDSHELYKGILEGKSRSVFTGRIYVHEGAQKTDAKQTNRNLLLSPEAVANSNPQLEIFADDVRCTHGSTIGQLDETAVFYLRSRGIGEEAAKSLLTYAFAADIVGRIKVPEVKRDLEEFLFRRLPRGEVVRQAV